MLAGPRALQQTRVFFLLLVVAPIKVHQNFSCLPRDENDERMARVRDARAPSNILSRISCQICQICGICYFNGQCVTIATGPRMEHD